MNSARALATLALLCLVACGPKSPPPSTSGTAIAAKPPASPVPSPQVPSGIRLPKDARPIAYRMTLTVDPAADVITGTGEIDIERTTAGGVLYLNGRELTVIAASLRAGTAPAIPLTATAVSDDVLAFVRSDDGAALPAGRATLALSWQARVHHDDTQGAFSQKNDGAWFAFTQFEPDSARRAIPCFDEPGFKTPWQLTLRVPEGLVALSNTPVVSETKDGAMTRVEFAATPPLPSYLIAYSVGPYEMVDAGKTRSGAPVRIAVPRGHADEAAIPVEDTVPILNVLEDYFGMPYPYAKLDMVPIPDTVAFGAMENVGLITWSSDRLLTKPADRTVWSRRAYAYTASHEIAHQWFGNLVTPAWWDDIWLNESFASWMGDRAIDRWKPEWGTALGNIGSKGRVMSADSRDSARPIRSRVEDANGMLDAFDPGIVYGKGRAVLEMIESHVGPDAFQKGIRAHLKKHAQGNATFADLIATLQEASGKDLQGIADDFVNQPGVPLVSFSLDCEKGHTPRLDMTQRRFVPFGSTIDPKRTWDVPVVVRWQAGKATGTASMVLKDASGSLELTGAKACPDWVMPNAGGSGYYRWSLAEPAFAKLRSSAVFKSLPPEERLEVAASVAALVASDDLPLRRHVEIAVTLMDDPERRIREIGLGAAAGWAEWLPADMRPAYRAWVAKTYGPLATTLGMLPKAGESDDDKAIRSQVVSRMADDAEDPATLKEATRLAMKWLDDRKSVPAETVDKVLAIAAGKGDVKLYERFLAEARKASAANDKSERERFLGMLGVFRDPVLVDRTRAMVLGDEFPILETQQYLYDQTDTPEGQERAWKYLTENYDAIAAKLPAETRGRLIAIAGDCRAASLERTKAFFAERTKKELKGPQTYSRFVETQTLCIARREKDTASLVEMLREQRGVR